MLIGDKDGEREGRDRADVDGERSALARPGGTRGVVGRGPTGGGAAGGRDRIEGVRALTLDEEVMGG